jgi:hypothetical protein
MPTLGRRQACAPSHEQEEQMIRNDVAGTADVTDVARRRPALRCWLRGLPGRGSSANVLHASAWSGLLLALASCSVGLLAAFLAREAPLGLLGLVVPLALLWSSYDQQTRGAAEARLYAELAQGQERATGRSSQVSASVVVTSAARLLAGADVELVLLTAEGPVRYHANEAGAAQGHPVPPGAFEPPWALRALGQTGVVTGTDEAGAWLSALIGTPDAPTAVLRARRPAGAGGFGRRETRLVDVLVVQAEAWLSAAQTSALPPGAAHAAHPAEQAARALGDVGAATAPALSMLRESADRLARLAETPDGVEHIVEELHHVERAVASLLGAVALAAEPDLLRLPEPDERPRPESASDWTTTGVLA